MSRDLRSYTSKTNFRLIIGGLALLFVVGVGLIGLIYGFKAALMAFICLIGGLVPIGLVALLMFGLEGIVKKINRDK